MQNLGSRLIDIEFSCCTKISKIIYSITPLILQNIIISLAYYSHFFKEKEAQFESTCISSFLKRQVVTKICTRLNFILTLLNEFAFVTGNDHEVEFHEIEIQLFQEVDQSIMRSKFNLFMRSNFFAKLIRRSNRP